MNIGTALWDLAKTHRRERRFSKPPKLMKNNNITASSVRKRRLAAIRGWRKALALGAAAGLAGLAPMKAHEYVEPHATIRVSQADLQLPAFKEGYEDGKAFSRVPGAAGNDEKLLGAAIVRAIDKGYADRGEETRDFVQGWMDGYVTTHGSERRSK
jgi:hypothetical protein